MSPGNSLIVQSSVASLSIKEHFMELTALIYSLQLLFFGLTLVFIGVTGGYIGYVVLSSKKPWKLKIDENYRPMVSILIPVHDEEGIIESKLENVKSVVYPRELMEIVIADDASKDETLIKVENFVKANPELKIRIIKQLTHEGKSAALNKALSSITNDIVIVTDADTTWSPEMLQKALPYLSDSSVGAITCRGVNTNSGQSWVTKAEDTYLNYANLMRLGESKVHSTIKFEGGFCAYRRGVFKEFDRVTGADDSGTALEIVQNNYRTLLVPEVVFYTSFPTKLKGKLSIKVRRATQLLGLWIKCLKLLAANKLRLSKKVAIPEILLFVFLPWVFLSLFVTVVALVVLYPLSLTSLIILALTGGLILLARNMFFEVVIDNLILCYALINILRGQRYVAWGRTK